MLRRVLVLASVCAMVWTAAANDAPVRYDGYKVVRITVADWAQIDQVKSLGARLMSDAEGPGDVNYLLPPPKAWPRWPRRSSPFRL